ncbi:hypothetical protein DM01DRAFT_1333997 [Hesseltinella vesiculosa]|uniref:Uncharacterized protein n=1 Tax=Hesseltinella vesiculosa TaxID=101127 RepID=A0A1X2GMK0_9FUNG|nr:hypothetical protein DM01DRAFT_1333997 [Hesseltinella vesiculosa]
MNVVAASNLPPTCNESARWFKRLLKYTKKKKPVPKQPTATCMAAATEKCIRRRYSSIQCENLTAREFAHLTGIDIVTTDEVDDQLYINTTHQSNLSLQGATMRSCRTSVSCKKPGILDQDFWQLSRTSTCQDQTSSVSSCSNSSHQTSFSAISGFCNNSASTTLTNIDPDKQKHLACVFSSSCNTSRPCSVIQKGRFKIVVGDDPDEQLDQDLHHDAIVSPPPAVVEWKRKRSQESAPCPTTITVG